MNQRILSSLGALVLLAGCTSGNSAVEPPIKGTNPTKNAALTFAVGTANYTLPDTGTQAVGLNTVVAYRQPDGLSAALVSTPALTGPAGFTVPDAASAYKDAGTGHITGQSQLPTDASQTTTFGQSGGAFAYGFLPLNSTNEATTGNNGYTPYSQPFYTDASTVDGDATDDNGNSLAAFDQALFLGGPPTFTNVRTGTYPSGFTGYTLGFDSFLATTLVAGTYNLALTVPTSATTNGTISASAGLASTAPLPVYPVPNVVSEDGTGGTTIELDVPAGVLETVVEIADYGNDPGASDSTSACQPLKTSGAPIYGYPYNYTIVDHTPGPAVVDVTLSDTNGPVSPTTSAASPSLCAGDGYLITAVGGDYGIAEAAPGQGNANGTAEAPSFFLTGSSGQADLTVSGENFVFYGEEEDAAQRHAAFKKLRQNLRNAAGTVRHVTTHSAKRA